MCERIHYLILPMRQLSYELSGSHRCVKRSNHPRKRYERAVRHYAGPVSNHLPKRRERAVRQDAGSVSYPPPKRHGGAIVQYTGPVSNRTLRRSNTRATRWIIRWAHLESNRPPKRYVQAVGQPLGMH